MFGTISLRDAVFPVQFQFEPVQQNAAEKAHSFRFNQHQNL